MTTVATHNIDRERIEEKAKQINDKKKECLRTTTTPFWCSAGDGSNG
jgi:hypothetical protein